MKFTNSMDKTGAENKSLIDSSVLCFKFGGTKPEIIQHRGYPVEIHSVTTADGYILEIHRIPHGRAGPVVGRRQRPVFLQHGLFDSDADFLINANDRALGNRLASASTFEYRSFKVFFP